MLKIWWSMSTPVSRMAISIPSPVKPVSLARPPPIIRVLLAVSGSRLKVGDRNTDSTQSSSFRALYWP